MITAERRKYMQEWRRRNPEKNRAYYKKWAKTNWRDYYKSNQEKRIEQAAISASRNYDPESRRENNARMYKLYPEKFSAREKARRIIPIKPCEVCGDKKTHRHHPDYSKPLEVVFLCRKHHGLVHRKF